MFRNLLIAITHVIFQTLLVMFLFRMWFSICFSCSLLLHDLIFESFSRFQSTFFQLWSLFLSSLFILSTSPFYARKLSSSSSIVPISSAIPDFALFILFFFLFTFWISHAVYPKLPKLLDSHDRFRFLLDYFLMNASRSFVTILFAAPCSLFPPCAS